VSVGVAGHEPVPRRYRGSRHARTRGHAQLVDVAAAVVLVREPGRIGQLLGQVARVHRLGREATRLHGARHETARVEGLGQQAAIVRQVFPVPDKQTIGAFTLLLLVRDEARGELSVIGRRVINEPEIVLRCLGKW
jgi:hypothetical protein